MKQDNGIDKKGHPVDVLPLSQRRFDGWATFLPALKSAGITLLFLSTVAGCTVHSPRSTAHSPESEVHGPKSTVRNVSAAGAAETARPEAVALPNRMPAQAVPCPHISWANGWVYFYTNCVLANAVQLKSNGFVYGQEMFIGYVTTNGTIRLQCGTNEPLDWAGMSQGWYAVHTWTLQSELTLADAWQDDASVSTPMTFVRFEETNAVEANAFYRIKYQ